MDVEKKKNLFSRRLVVPIINGLVIVFVALIFFFGEKSLFFYLTGFETLSQDEMTFALEIAISQGILLIISLVSLFLGVFNKKNGEVFLAVMEIALSLLTAGFAFSNGNVFVGILAIFELILGILLLVTFLLLEARERKEHPVTEEAQETEKKENIIFLRISEIVCSVLAFLSSAGCYFIPFYTAEDGNTYRLIDALSPECADPIVLISFIFYFFFVLFLLLSLAKNLESMYSNTQKFIRSNKNLLYSGLGLSLLFYVYGVILGRFVSSSTSDGLIYTANAIPFLVNSLLVILESCFSSRYIKSKDDEGKEFSLSSRVTVLIFATLLSALAVVSSLMDIVTINLTQNKTVTTTFVNGLDVLTNYTSMGKGYQTLAFLIFADLVVVSLFLVFEWTAFFRRSRSFYRVSYTGIIISYLFVFGLFLFGFYYQMAEKMNEENILSYLKYAGISISTEDYDVTATSDSWPYFVTATVLMFALALAKPFTKHIQEESVDVNIKSAQGLNDATLPSKGETPLTNGANKGIEDPCPAFLELDEEEKEREELQKKREAEAFENPTLPALTDFIVEYAKNSRLHLTYSKEMIATFLAGLGDSKLSILQGMSGTGKTSLPKIFSEAIDGDCRIVEVESSWKDKNELIGYYNEFTKLFTPKKFTQALYASTLNKDSVTLIVLDEMNLSRIEYYFSDFLSLMENEPDKRTFRVVNVPLYYQKNGQPTPYLGLEKGHTIRITPNIWFIGTANRDESTFEISDKVYDRANTINFDSRASKAVPDQEPMKPRYVSYPVLQKLFDDAKKNSTFALELVPNLSKAEALLTPYNISYGNRIANQMEDFVKIYSACFPEGKQREQEALETIFLSKVVHKLEYKTVENKEELSENFARLGYNRCAQFILHLSEDE